MRVREIRVRSVLGKSSIADYCVNPYVGCTHGCRYCYAEYYTKRSTSHRGVWGSYLDVKINAPEVLEIEIKKSSKGSVYISSLTDPYQQFEKKYEITRRILKVFLNYDWPIIVQTKSSLVLRDLEILSNFKSSQVGITITTLDEKVAKLLEPYAPSPRERIETLHKLHENEINTYAFLGPIFPFTPIEDVRDLIDSVAPNVDTIYIDKLNLKPGILSNLSYVLDENTLEMWKKAARGQNPYYIELKSALKEFLKKKKIHFSFVF